MERYRNSGGNSGVSAYEIGDDFITVWFKGGKRPYNYSHRKAISHHVENMKSLANQGQGLNSYIMNYVKLLYD